MELSISFEIMGEIICVSYHANAFEKGMNLSILPKAMGKIVG